MVRDNWVQILALLWKIMKTAVRWVIVSMAVSGFELYRGLCAWSLPPTPFWIALFQVTTGALRWQLHDHSLSDFGPVAISQPPLLPQVVAVEDIID